LWHDNRHEKGKNDIEQERNRNRKIEFKSKALKESVSGSDENNRHKCHNYKQENDINRVFSKKFIHSP